MVRTNKALLFNFSERSSKEIYCHDQRGLTFYDRILQAVVKNRFRHFEIRPGYRVLRSRDFLQSLMISNYG